jgi:hypothetical protein
MALTVIAVVTVGILSTTTTHRQSLPHMVMVVLSLYIATVTITWTIQEKSGKLEFIPKI